MEEVLTQALFWQQVLTDSERTVVCFPGYAERCQQWVDDAGLGGLIHIHPSALCPPDQLLVLDQHACDAYLAQAVQRWSGSARPGRNG